MKTDTCPGCGGSGWVTNVGALLGARDPCPLCAIRSYAQQMRAPNMTFTAADAAAMRRLKPDLTSRPGATGRGIPLPDDCIYVLPECPGIVIIRGVRWQGVGDAYSNECEVHLHRCAECWSLGGLYVPLALRRHGVGSVLMSWALQYVAREGPELPVILETRPWGPDAPTVAMLRAFYARFGFERWPLHPVSMVRWPLMVNNNEHGKDGGQ